MACVLLFNIKDEKKLTGIRLLALKQGAEIKIVSPGDFSKTMRDILASDNFAQPGNAAPESGAFEGGMLVMHGFSRTQFDGFLDSLRNAGISVALKAVVTETNISWSAEKLYRELSLERKALSKSRSSVHSKRKA